MKDLEKMFDKAIEIVKECVNGVEIRPINRPISINTRAKTRWGCCKYRSYTGDCTIEISSRILGDDVPDDATMGTIIHEILHACKGCKGHGAQWKRYANAVNRKYPQYNITRTCGADEFGLSDEQDKFRQKYAIKCVACGHIHYSSKLSKSIQHPEKYQCKCGGQLIRIDVKDIKAEVVAPTPSLSGHQMCLMDFI